jgi:hypothetical protein
MTNTQHTFKPLTSAGVRIAIALAVAVSVAAAWTGTEHESRRAVETATTAIEGPLYVTLPSVEIIGQRMKAGEAVAAL